MKRSLILGATVLTTLGIAAGPAMAKNNDVKASATCTAGVKGKIKAGAREHNRMLQIEVEIDDVGRTPKTWVIVVKDNDETKTRTATTGGRSNEVSREFHTINGAGADTVSFTATRDGASCTGTVVVP